MATRIYKTPFAATGDKEALATADQPDGKVSLPAGWTPDYELPSDHANYRPVGRAEMNGVINEVTAALGDVQLMGFAKWQPIDGGWPLGARVIHLGVAFLSVVDANTAEPQALDAGWVPAFNYGIGTVNLTNANVRLGAEIFSKPIIYLAGALITNVQVLFPPTMQQWLVVNLTTGNFTVTCKTSAGTGVAIAQGGVARIYGDGTNILLRAEQVGPATHGGHAAQLSQVDAAIRNAGFATEAWVGAYYQAKLGFTPVEQGGGAGMYGNKVRIGWGGSSIRAQVDSLDLGEIWTDQIGAARVAASTATFSTGAVGTYAFMRNSTDTYVAPGGTIAGSLLYFSDGDEKQSGVGVGTWRAMGYGSAKSVSVWLRIA